MMEALHVADELESREQARKLRDILEAVIQEVDRLDEKQQYTMQFRKHLFRMRTELIAEARRRFGVNANHPHCQTCLEVSVFGGPDHEPSASCQSGHNPHCSCSACW